MPTPPKKSTAPTPPPASGWRSRVSAAPVNWGNEMAAARQRADSWSLSNILSNAGSGLMANLGVLQEPASNLASLLPARIVGSNEGNLAEIVGRAAPAVKSGPAKLTPAQLQTNAYMQDEAMRRELGVTPTAKPATGYTGMEVTPAATGPADPLSGAFGPRSQQIARGAQQRKEAETKRQQQIRAEADARVAGENTDNVPILERVLRNTPLAPFFDSRAGLYSTAMEAGYDPSAALAAEMLNPLSYTPADLTAAAGAGALRKLQGKSLLPAYEGVGLGKRPFQQPAAPLRMQRATAAPGETPDWWSPTGKPQRAEPTALPPGYNEAAPPLSASTKAAAKPGWRDRAGLAPLTEPQLDTTPKPGVLLPENTPLSSALPTGAVAEHEYVAAAKEVLANGGGVDDVALHLDLSRDQAASLVARLTPIPEPAGYKGGLLTRPESNLPLRSSGSPLEQLDLPTPEPAVPNGWKSRLLQRPESKLPLRSSGAPLEQLSLEPHVAPETPGPLLQRPPSALPLRPSAGPYEQLPVEPYVAPESPGGLLQRPQSALPLRPSEAPLEQLPVAPYEPPSYKGGLLQSGWRQRVAEPTPPPMPPSAPSVPAESPAAPMRPVTPSAPQNAPEVPANASQTPSPIEPQISPDRSRFAPTQPTPTTPPKEVSTPAAARAAEGVSGPIASDASAVGAGAKEAPGNVVESLAARWDSMPAKERARWHTILNEEQRAALNEAVVAQRGPKPAADRRKKMTAAAIALAAGSQLGFATPEQAGAPVEGEDNSAGKLGLGLAALVGGYVGGGKLLSGAAGKSVGNAMQRFESLATHAAQTAGTALYDGLAPSRQEALTKAKRATEYYLRKSMLSDAVEGNAQLASSLEDSANAIYASAQRAQDDWAPLRKLPKADQAAVVEALRDPAKMQALAAVDPTVGAMAQQARGRISQLTQEVLAQQFAVPMGTWQALSNAERAELANLIKKPGATTTNAQLDQLATLSRAKLLANGALVKDASGALTFKDPMLAAGTALKNAESYLQRRFAALSGAKGVDVEAVLARHGAALNTAEKEELVKLLGDKQQGGAVSQERIGMLIQRKNLSPAFKAALGEIKDDASYLVGRTVHELEQHLTLSTLRTAIAENSSWVMPLGDDVQAAAQRWGTTPVPLADDPNAYGILAGRMVHPEVADVLFAHHAFTNPGAVRDAIDKIVGAWRFSKTVANPASHLRQFAQNLVGLDLAGDGLVSGIGRFKTALGEMAELGPMYREARDAGLFRGTFADVELSRVLHREILGLPDGGHSFERLGRIGEAIHNVKLWGEQKWQLSDDATRLALWGYAREQGMAPKEALAYINQTLYSGSEMSRLERAASGRGISQTMRSPNMLHKVADGIGVLASAPFLMSSLYGLRRGAQAALGVKAGHWMPMTSPDLAWRASKYWVLPALAAGAVGAEVMDSRPDYAQPYLDERLPTNVPLPNAASAVLGTNGAPQFMDISSFVHWGEVARVTVDSRNNPGDDSILGRFASVAMMRNNPPLNPILQAYLDVRSNRDSFTGKPITNSSSTREAASDYLGYATRSLAPDWTPGVASALASGRASDLVKQGGRAVQQVGAGAYNSVNDALAYYQNNPSPSHVTDYRLRDQTLPRAILGQLGIRTYETDAALNASMADIQKTRSLREEQSRFAAYQRSPAHTDAEKAADAERSAKRVQNITTGGLQKASPGFLSPSTLRDLLKR